MYPGPWIGKSSFRWVRRVGKLTGSKHPAPDLSHPVRPMPPDPPIRVLAADDDEAQRLLLRHHLADSGFEVEMVEDGLEALEALEEGSYDVAILDLLMPRADGIDVLRRIAGEQDRPEVIVVTAHGTIETAIEAMKLGAYDYITKPHRPEELILLVRRAWERRRLSRDNRRHQAREARDTSPPEIVTQDPGMLRILEMARKVAPSESPVLITGESGTGKELVAQTVHRLSRRSRKSLVAVNCAALPGGLLESELFGHEKGAFSGAVERKLGLFELADRGTLFMDEIGDLASELQGKLLRVLEDGTFRRVGGVRDLRTDFRLLAATNRRLPEMVEEGSFRDDLYYRVSTIVLELPPLRARPDDVPLIARHFLRTLPRGREGDWALSDEAVAKLRAYPWPGNVRELRNVIERATLLAEDRTVTPEDIPLGRPVSGLGESAVAPGPGALDEDVSLKAMERRHISYVLDRTGWHQGKAAELLGISPKTLYRKIREYGLERP